MATPIVQPDGTKCYSGANCLRHGSKTLSTDFLKKNLNDKLAELDSFSNPLAKYTPVEVDEQLSDLYEASFMVQLEIQEKLSIIDRINASLEKNKENPDGLTYRTSLSSLEMREGQLEKLTEELQNLQAEAAPYETEYLRRPWTRAFLVDNTNGHVHKDMRCSTCFPTTRYTWLPAYSGSTEKKIVEDAGEAACTVCYPSAPVDVLRRPSKMEAPAKKKAREERAAAREKKAAETLAKSISMPDGSVLKTEYSGTIKTERTAAIEAVDTASYIYAIEEGNVYKDRDLNMVYIDKRKKDLTNLIAALAYKHGTSVEEETSLVREKAIKKFKKEYKDFL